MHHRFHSCTLADSMTHAGGMPADGHRQATDMVQPHDRVMGPQVGTNILGHCGYEAPLWLHATITAGVGLTPLAATSKSHFLHHIDPRYNRSLYFTWWDRLFGTYREDHPLIFEGAR